MFFASDNAGPVHPKVMAALARANDGHSPAYGSEGLMEEVRDRIRSLFEAPEAAVYLVATGTAANSLTLATLAQPWQTVFCSNTAHIHEDECNAPEFFSGGAKLTPIAAPDGRMAPDALRSAILGEETRGVHGAQRGPVSLTQATERGTAYDLDHLRTLTAVAREFYLPVHIDGARFSNALVHLGCTPAEMTWQSGVDAVVFGGTKNGLMGVEAVVLFDPARAEEFEYRRKRGAQLFSKHRYLSAQMAAYLTDDLWHQNASAANASAARLAKGLAARGLPPVDPVEANMVFFRAPRALHQRLMAAGAVYSLWDGALEGAPEVPVTARLVCDWSIGPEEVDRFLALI